MKKLLLTVLLALSSCSPAPASTPTYSTSETYVPRFEAFRSSEDCPNTCWLGIHPGVTTAKDAIWIIRNSEQFLEQFTQQTDNNIQAYWFPERTKTFGSHVTVNFSAKGIVDSISMGSLAPFTVNDFISLLGEPDEISLFAEKDAVHGEYYITYTLYYSSFKTRLQISPGRDKMGPNPNDPIGLLIINIPTDNTFRQDWLGYGHLDEYLLHVEPTPLLSSP